MNLNPYNENLSSQKNFKFLTIYMLKVIQLQRVNNALYFVLIKY